MENNDDLNNEKKTKEKQANNNEQTPEINEHTPEINEQGQKKENEKIKNKKKGIKENQLNDMKYEILKEESSEYDLSFKVIVIGNSGI